MRARFVAALVVVLAMLLVVPAGWAHKGHGWGKGPRAVDLDALFVGAHPDDEAFTLATYGQWGETYGVDIGVVTITRGEGGGNAQGPEEGPPLGLIREAEERRAVGKAGIENVFYLDKVDFWYTLSAPLTEQIWGHDDTLERLVRVIRTTRPEVLFTMDPSPNNHGNHAQAARLSVEAFAAAADPNAFPEQLRDEGLHTWRVQKIFRVGASGTTAAPTTPDGSDCPDAFTPSEPTDIVYSVWTGAQSQRWNATWAQVARDAQREYLTQGWGAFPPTVSPPFECDAMTLIDSRVPIELEGTTPAANTPDDPAAALQGSLVAPFDGLSLGTELYLTVDPFDVVPGASFEVTAHARTAHGKGLHRARVELQLPAGWQVTNGNGRLGDVGSREATTTFTVTVPANAAESTRFLLGATLTAKHGPVRATTYEPVRVVPAVEGTLQRLPDIGEFETWARGAGVPQLVGLVTPVLPLGAGETRTLGVTLTNHTDAAESGTVALANLPTGVTATPASLPYTVPANGTATVQFTVTAAATVATSTEVQFDIQTTSSTGPSSEQPRPALFLVPTTTIPQATTAPVVDGVASPGEYDAATPLDIGKLWEGDPSTWSGAADWSGNARVVWNGDALYLLIQVTDDVLGTKVAQADCKRHWRSDSIEIALDPRGTSDNTSTVFKTGIFPATAEGGPCAERDADNWQGPAATTAPGMQVASTVSDPYTGYVLEVKIDLADLPSAVDPSRLGLNVIGYDSDTQDLTGQNRFAWQNVGPAQVVPFRWGLATLPGYTPPAGRPTEPKAPTIPTDVARSALSPQSILQSATNGVPLAGLPAVPRGQGASLDDARLAGDRVKAQLRTSATGTAEVFAWDPDWAAAYAGAVTAPHQTVNAWRHRTQTVRLDLGTSGFDGGWVLAAWQPAGAEGYQALAEPVRAKHRR